MAFQGDKINNLTNRFLTNLKINLRLLGVQRSSHLPPNPLPPNKKSRTFLRGLLISNLVKTLQVFEAD